jgi:hypothetical protein
MSTDKTCYLGLASEYANFVEDAYTCRAIERIGAHVVVLVKNTCSKGVGMQEMMDDAASDHQVSLGPHSNHQLMMDGSPAGYVHAEYENCTSPYHPRVCDLSEHSSFQPAASGRVPVPTKS